ncbi:hypothetical protein Ciccas_005268 [Cichlidogyrus casuarinus]|uniref:Uncharacterized protein n=1 Tax=Cichlidogyrus casuarinus TaxID=1844966 RepID=A0ABD2Q987_9PLAT
MKKFFVIGVEEKIRLRWPIFTMGAVCVILSFVGFGIVAQKTENSQTTTLGHATSGLILFAGVIEMLLAATNTVRGFRFLQFLNIVCLICCGAASGNVHLPKEQPVMAIFSIMGLVVLINIVLCCVERCCCSETKVIAPTVAAAPAPTINLVVNNSNDISIPNNLSHMPQVNTQQAAEPPSYKSVAGQDNNPC